MPFDDALRDAAERLGIQQQFWDNFGTPHVTTEATNRAIIAAIEAATGGISTETASVVVMSQSDPFIAPSDLEIVTETGERIRLAAGATAPKLTDWISRNEIGPAHDAADRGSGLCLATDAA